MCHKEYEEQYFDRTQNKCILHCEKENFHGDTEDFITALKTDIKKTKITKNKRFDKIHFVSTLGYEDIFNQYEQIEFIN